MTTCVAAVCDYGNTIVMVADKMIGMGYVESELEVTKMRQLHPDWWMLFAGDDLTSVFDIVDYAKADLDQKQPATLAAVKTAVTEAYAKRRIEDAEALYLTPIDWSLADFNRDGNAQLPNFSELQSKIESYVLPIELLVAGFENKRGHVFSLSGYGEKRGIPSRYDIPGFHSVGSGSTVAMFMMYYRDMSPGTSVREAVYYALEAKYFGEQASGVGASTDLFVARPGKEILQINDEEIVEEKLIPICYALSPSLLRKRDYEVLNSISGLEGFPEVKRPAKKEKPKPQKSPPTQ
jgi:20S proteasome alpha/beta subunit